MTIISVTYVPEGIAMAADSRLTYTRVDEQGGLEKYPITDNAQKIVLIRNSSIGVAFCGAAILEGKTLSDIIRIFDIMHVQESHTVKEVATNLKNYIFDSYGDISIAFIIAGYDDDVPFVFSISSLEITQDNIPGTVGEYGASWKGEHEPFTNALTNFSFNATLMPLKDAADFSEFIVDFTIKYQRFADRIPTCGGHIDLLVITKDYTKFLKHKILQP